VVNGAVVDSTNGAGGIKGMITLPQNNPQLPLLDEDTYRLFDYTIETKAAAYDNETRGQLNFWFDLSFTNALAYDILATSDVSNLTVSAQIYVNDDSIRPQVEALFDRLVAEGWLRRWFTQEQAAAEGLEGPFQYVVEGGEGYFFADAIKPQFFNQSWAKDGGEYIGKHGHHPSRGDMPPFLVSMPGLECRELQDHSILDIAPTLQALLDLPQWPMAGKNLLA
jgi:hypothetical protein